MKDIPVEYEYKGVHYRGILSYVHGTGAPSRTASNLVASLVFFRLRRLSVYDVSICNTSLYFSLSNSSIAGLSSFFTLHRRTRPAADRRTLRAPQTHGPLSLAQALAEQGLAVPAAVGAIGLRRGTCRFRRRSRSAPQSQSGT